MMLLAMKVNELVIGETQLAIMKGGGCLGKSDYGGGLSGTSHSTYNLRNS